MNNNEYLLNLELKNRRALMRIYQRQRKKLLDYIYKGALRGNDLTYLKNLRADVEGEIIKMRKEYKAYSVAMSKASAEAGVRYTDTIVNQLSLFATAGVTAQGLGFGVVNRRALKTYANIVANPLSDLAQKTGRATLDFLNRENFKSSEKALKALGNFVDSKTLAKMGLEGVQDVVVGSQSWQQGMRAIRDDLLKKGALKIPYYNKAGKVVRMVDAKNYAELVSRTTTANIMRESCKEEIIDIFGDDGDLVEILGISDDPNSPCIPFQGEVLSLNGETQGYTTVAEAEAEGLFHPNCIHSFGVTDKVYKIYQNNDGLAELKAKIREANK